VTGLTGARRARPGVDPQPGRGVPSHCRSDAVSTPLLLAILAVGPVGEPPDLCAPVQEEAAEAAQTRFEQAQALLLESRWAEAEPLLREALGDYPGHALARYGLGQALIEQGRPGDAARAFAASRAAFRCIAEADPEVRAAMSRRLDAQLMNLRQSLSELERSSLIEQSVAWKEANSRLPHATRGDAPRQRRELEKAIEELERARKAPDPAPSYVTLALGTALVHAGDFEAAERELRAAVSADPASGDAHNNLAVALLMTGSLDEAEREAREAERLGVPVNPRLYEEIHRRRK